LVAKTECVPPRFLYGDGVISEFGANALEPTRGDGVDAVSFATGGVDAVASATDGVDVVVSATDGVDP